MSDIFEPDQESKAATFVVNPARLASGRYDHARSRDVGEGDIHASYSADTIGTAGKIRRVFHFQGRLMVTVSIWSVSGLGPVVQAEAYELVPLGAFTGTPTTYGEKLATADSADAARRDPSGFYHSMKVTCGRECFVMYGPPMIFEATRSPVRPSDQPENAGPEQLSLF